MSVMSVARVCAAAESSRSAVDADLLMRYAEEVSVIGGLTNPRLREVLALVDRSQFLPPGPWHVEALDGRYYLSGTTDPRHILHAVGVALDPGRGLNNGNPANVARLIQDAFVTSGETVFQVGAGTGYYSALLSELIGPTGRLIAAEIDPVLCDQAKQNLASRSWVSVCGDATALSASDLPDLDVLFFNSGVAHLPVSLFRRVAVGGRVILPLTGTIQGGPIFRLIRRDDGRFSVDFLTAQRYFPCLGTRASWAEAGVDSAIAKASPQLVSELRLDEDASADGAWLHGPGWSFHL